MKYLISDDQWDIKGYWEQVRSLRPRLSKRAFGFFSKHSFHDAQFLSMNVINQCPPHRRGRLDPTKVEIRLLDCSGYEYTVTWFGVVKLEFSFDGRLKEYYGLDGTLHYWEEDRRGLDEWGYDELTIFDDTYLSHEIQLHSGTTIIMHFSRLDYKRSIQIVKRLPWLEKKK